MNGGLPCNNIALHKSNAIITVGVTTILKIQLLVIVTVLQKIISTGLLLLTCCYYCIWYEWMNESDLIFQADMLSKTGELVKWVVLGQRLTSLFSVSCLAALLTTHVEAETNSNVRYNTHHYTVRYIWINSLKIIYLCTFSFHASKSIKICQLFFMVHIITSLYELTNY